jgi:hypothetical protein
MGRRVYRVEWERWLHVAIFGALTVALLFMADDGARAGSAGTTAQIVGYAMVAFGCVLIIRSARIAVVTTDDEFIVRGIFRTRRFDIAEIDGFTVGQRASSVAPAWWAQPSFMAPPTCQPRDRSRDQVGGHDHRQPQPRPEGSATAQRPQTGCELAPICRSALDRTSADRAFGVDVGSRFNGSALVVPFGQGSRIWT